MGRKLLVIGESGSGKSTSTRNLDPKTTMFVNCIGKPLPFKGWRKNYTTYDRDSGEGNMIRTHSAKNIVEVMKHVDGNMPHIKTIIVDDSQYIMSYEFMERAEEKGFDKFIQIGKNMWNVFRAPDELRDDLTVVFFGHSEDVSANGFTKTKIKTIGKMLDEKITVEGMFTIVLLATCFMNKDKAMEYVFVTQSNGTNTAKTPMDMFKEKAIPNDLDMVIKKVIEYDEG